MIYEISRKKPNCVLYKLCELFRPLSAHKQQIILQFQLKSNRWQKQQATDTDTDTVPIDTTDTGDTQLHFNYQIAGRLS